MKDCSEHIKLSSNDKRCLNHSKRFMNDETKILFDEHTKASNL